MSVSFFDSNVLLYLASDEPDRVLRVRQLVDSGGIISVQILNEMTSVSRRKFGMSWSETRALLTEMRDLLAIVPLTPEIHESGIRLAERYVFAVYDSFIVAAALAADCDTLWSEDMQNGMLVEGRLRIANPFRA
ncbi:PIN domain-containing protein [Rhodopseudomonas sp. RCAM05734]|uniref:PIN domain-containing protein n=1 Tax=Rhodopseudomonas sp. RCAM05734 TaxID=3457549 RepID=UPI004044F621